MNELIALQGKNFDPRGVEADVLQNQMRQQSLQSGQFDMQQKQEAIARQNQMRNMLQSLPQDMTPEQVTNALVRAGSPEMAGTYIKSVREAGKAQNEGEKAKREAEGFTRDQAIKATTQLAQRYQAALADPNVSPDKLADDIASMHAQGIIPRNAAEAELKILDGMTDPAQFKRHLKTRAQAGMTLVDQINAAKPTYETIDLNGVKRTIARYPDGRAEVVRDDKVSESPDAILAAKTKKDIAAAEMASKERELSKPQVVTDPVHGVVVVDKNSATYKAVQGENGPLNGKDTRSAAIRYEQVKASIDEVEKLLPSATGSYIGKGIDEASRAFGYTNKGSIAAQKLKTLAGWMVANVPRMEGPQSDKDVLLYREMAGNVGDDTLPVEARQEAIKTLKALQEKYANLNKDQSQGLPLGTTNSKKPSPGNRPPIGSLLNIK